MKLVGSVLVFCGGCWWYYIALKERGSRQKTLERLLGNLHEMREIVGGERLPLPQVLERLGEEGTYFGRVREMLRYSESFEFCWSDAAKLLDLSKRNRSIWCWLGTQLTGNEQSVIRALDFAERELEAERQKMMQESREVSQRKAVVCFSTAALLVILLL